MGELLPEQWPELLHAWRFRHKDSPRLQQLAREAPYTPRRRLTGLVTQCLRELGTAAPLERHEAAAVLRLTLAQQVVDGTLAPHQLTVAMSRWLNFELESPAGDFVQLNQ